MNVARNNDAAKQTPNVRSVWVRATPLTGIPVGGHVVFHVDNRRIAIFRPGADEVYAVDDQCPHEGYPLSRGSLMGQTLTCCWHNYKFDLRSGHCLRGDEDVRSHPTRIRHGFVEIQVLDEPLHVSSARYMSSLGAALHKGRVGQVARDLVRLLFLGVKPETLAFFAARYDAEHAEYGSTHALPLAVDVLSIARRYPGTQAALPLMQAFELVAESCTRAPKRQESGHIVPVASPTVAAFELAVEKEEIENAQGILRAALTSGMPRKTIESWFLALCARHFLGFGHALIYTVKAFDLLAIVGWEHALGLLPGLLVKTIQQTREDLLPEWRWFRERLAEIRPNLENAGDCFRSPIGAVEVSLVDLVLDGSRHEAFDAVGHALFTGVHPETILNALSVAASTRILHFDVFIDHDSRVQEGWLDVTHLLTFINAVRHALRRWQSPASLSLLFQATRFINHAKPLERREQSPVAIGSQEATLASVIRDIHEARPAEAAARARQYLVEGGSPSAFEAALQDLALQDHVVRPITVAHWIKTCRAAFCEFDSLPSGPLRTRPIEAFARFAASPIRQRFIARYVYEAIRLVESGKVPKTLT